MNSTIKAHNLDISIAEDMFQYKSSMKAKIRTDSALAGVNIDPQSMDLGETERRGGLLPVLDLESHTKDNKKSLSVLPTPKSAYGKHFETHFSRSPSPYLTGSKNSSSNIGSQNPNLNTKSHHLPHTVIVESPEEDEGLILQCNTRMHTYAASRHSQVIIYTYAHILPNYQSLTVEFLICASVCHDCVVEMKVSQTLSYHGYSRQGSHIQRRQHYSLQVNI